jgi:predicted DNA-binding ribbon-helix-helix protein
MMLKDNIAEIKTTLVSRNITVMGKRTSVRLEPEMWLALKEISARECCSIHDICTLVKVRKNPRSSLTAAIRVFLMLYFRAAATEEGHQRPGQGKFEYMMQRARVPTQILPVTATVRRNHKSADLVEEAGKSLETAL